MKKTLLTAGAMLLTATTASYAADMRARPMLKAPPPIVAPIFNWTGFYIGGHLGYGFETDGDIITTGQAAGNVANVVGGARPGRVRSDRDGFIGGGQIGYNWQFAPSWVFGIEADISYVDFGRTTNVRTVGLNGIDQLNNTFSTRFDYFGTVRGRIGYAWDRTLLYVTGGLAYADIRNNVNFFGPAGQLQFTGGRSRLDTGFTVGGGIEHAFTPNWSVKGEYLYYDLGRNTVNVAVIPGSGGGGTGYNTSFRNEGHIGRIGLNYRFSAMGW